MFSTLLIKWPIPSLFLLYPWAASWKQNISSTDFIFILLCWFSISLPEPWSSILGLLLHLCLLPRWSPPDFRYPPAYLKLFIVWLSLHNCSLIYMTTYCVHFTCTFNMHWSSKLKPWLALAQPHHTQPPPLPVFPVSVNGNTLVSSVSCLFSLAHLSSFSW